MNAVGIKKSFYKALLMIAINVVALLFWQGNPVQAESIKIIVHGNELQPDVPPMMIEGRVMVPLKAIFDAVKVDSVIWDDQTKTVVAAKGENVIVLQINDKMALINDGPIELDVAPQIINGRTMVPARFIAESLDLDVQWLNDEKTVVVTEKITDQWEYYATDYFHIPLTTEESNQYTVNASEKEMAIKFDEYNNAYIEFLGNYPIELFDYMVSEVSRKMGTIDLEMVYSNSQEINDKQTHRFTYNMEDKVTGEYFIFHDHLGNFFHAMYASEKQSGNAYIEKFENILGRLAVVSDSEAMEEVVYEKVDTPLFSFSKRSDWEHDVVDVEAIELTHHTLEVSPMQLIQLSMISDSDELFTDNAMLAGIMRMDGDVKNLQKAEYEYKGFAAEEYTYERSFAYKRYDGEDAEFIIKSETMLIQIDDDHFFFIALQSPKQLYEETYELYMEVLDSLIIKVGRL